MEQPTPFEHSRQINDILRGYRTAQLLISFAELGIGDILADGPQTAAAIAAEVGADPDAMRRFLTAAAHFGLVVQEGDQYRNTSLTTDTLTSDGAASLVHFVRREAAFYRRFSLLTEAVRQGGRPAESEREEHAPDWVRNFTLALYDTARIAAPGIVEALRPLIEEFDHPVHVIDVGGGHGGYSIALAQAFPGLRAVVLDLPPVIEVTKEIVAATDVADRVTPMVGDFHRDDLGEGYDLALLFGVLVGEDATGSVRLLKRVREVMNPSGYVVIRSRHTGGAGESDLSSALVDLQMLLATRAGAAHSTDHTVAWMEQAGLTEVHSIELPAPATGTLLVGRVPRDE